MQGNKKVTEKITTLPADLFGVIGHFTKFAFSLVKWPQEKWACDFHDDATPLSFQLQVTEDLFLSQKIFIMEK